MSKLQKKPPALIREHLALQNMNFSFQAVYFCPPGSESGYSRGTKVKEFRHVKFGRAEKH